MRITVTLIVLIAAALATAAQNNVKQLHYRLKIDDSSLPPLQRIEYADSLRRVLPASADTLLLMQARLAYDNGYYREALRYARDYMRSQGDAFRKLPCHRQCDVMFLEVKACFKSGEYADGIENAHRLINMSKPDSLLYHDINCLSIIGDHISGLTGKGKKLEDYSLASYIKKGEKLLAKTEGKNIPANSIMRMKKALLFSKMVYATDNGKYQEAQAYGAQMLEYPVTEVEKTALKGNMALIYHKLGKLDMAEQYYRQVLCTPGRHYNHAVCLNNYMHLLIGEGRPKEAIELLSSHPEIIRISKGLESEADMLLFRAMAMYDSGDRDNAFFTLLRSRNIMDSVNRDIIKSLSSKLFSTLEANKETDEQHDDMSRWLTIWAITASALALAATASAAARHIKERNKKQQYTAKEAETPVTDRCEGGCAADVLQLASLNETIASIAGTLDDKSMADSDKLSRIKGELKEIASYDDLWQMFHIQFEKLHPSFFGKLKTEYPDLTPGETRMCSYVMLNMTNKEIAALTRRNIRSVETMRYRLTKKMRLEEGISLSARLFALAEAAAKE